jgi:uncharacterized repeat protein (TIGR03803 family)
MGAVGIFRQASDSSLNLGGEAFFENQFMFVRPKSDVTCFEHFLPVRSPKEDFMRPASLRHLALVSTATLMLIASAAASEPVSIHNFAENLMGCEPSALLIDPSGSLFGLAGDPNYASNCGMIFELQPQSNGAWKFQVLHQLGKNSTLSQQSPFTRDSKGNLFAATVVNPDQNPQSAIVELSPMADGKWSYQTIYTFGAGDGSLPSWLIVDASGNLYGTTTLGGIGNGGIVFELSRGASGQWTETVLYSFSSSPYSGEPDGLVMDASGDLFGTTYFGGDCSVGSVFELQPGTNGWTYSLLHSFCGYPDGNAPEGGLLIDKAGNLFGVTTLGGTGCGVQSTGCGTVFELSPNSGTWTESTLVNFTGPSGWFPFTLTMDSKGRLIGLNAVDGGQGYFGTMFELSLASNGQWCGRVIYRFSVNPRPNPPCCSLIVTPSGTIFGATDGASGNEEWGAVYEWTQP